MESAWQGRTGISKWEIPRLTDSGKPSANICLDCITTNLGNGKANKYLNVVSGKNRTFVGGMYEGGLEPMKTSVKVGCINLLLLRVIF